MIGFIWSHLRHKAARTMALLCGVLVAATGFTVLTGTTTTSRLTVTGTVDANARSAYDILVRPKGSRTPLEVERGLVRPNYLSGIFGGLTMRQYEQVRSVPGVDVAAPISMIGYAMGSFANDFDITGMVDRSAESQLLRIDPTFTSDRGLSHTTGEPTYVYVVKRPIAWPLRVDGGDSEHVKFTDGEELLHDRLCVTEVVALDHDAHGRPVPICDTHVFSEMGTDSQASNLHAVRLLPDGRFQEYGDEPTDRLTIAIGVHVPFLLAGIDPGAEDRLVGLRGALDGGRYLTPTDTVSRSRWSLQFPVLGSDRTYIDGSTSIKVSALPADTRVAGVPRMDLPTVLAAQPARPRGRLSDDWVGRYQSTMQRALSLGFGTAEAQHLIQTGPAEYDQAPDGTLIPKTVPADPEAYRTPYWGGLDVSWQIGDTAFRTLRTISSDKSKTRDTMLVGTYDPEKLTKFSELSMVPMETYQPPGVTGVDQRSRDLLGDQALLPDGNIAGYLASPPLLLTNLALVPDLLAGNGNPVAKAPVSAIRVRVAGVHGYTKESRERVRLVAEQIALATGLDVDITYGSSGKPQTVHLAAGAYGRPELTVSEPWSKKGVATVVVNAIDRKSAILFVLVLIVCALFLTNAVSAAVRNRRPELAILACLGWPRRRIGLAVLTEVLTVGAAAGVASLGLSAALGALLGVHLAWSHTLLALPVSLGVTLLAGAVPALRAARAHPAAALHPPAARARRARRPRHVLSLALVNLTRVPGRTLLGATALAIGIAGLTVLAAATFAFNGAIVGTVLGDAVSVRVRGVDTIAVIATVLLGCLAVADVLYLNIHDRAAELATLQATGWTDAALTRLVTYEGLGIGLLGALLGAGLGLAGAALLVGAVTATLVVTSVGAALGGTAIAGVAALIPAVALRRQPAAHLLAEE